MRLLIVADLHYSLPQYDWVVSVADRFDLVIIAGDHLDLSSMVDFRAQVVVVRKYLQKIKERTRLLTCSGNHDLDAQSPAGEKIARWMRDLGRIEVPADGDSLAIDGILFTMCAWWDGPIEQAAIGEQLAAAAKQRQDKWIWVYHAPPPDSPTSWSGSRSYGDTALGKWIAEYEPDIVFAGHVHQSPFIKDGSWADRIGKTWVFNAGHQFGAPPSHIILDTEAQSAVWLSAAGSQVGGRIGRLEIAPALERPVRARRHAHQLRPQVQARETAALPINLRRDVDDRLTHLDQPLDHPVERAAIDHLVAALGHHAGVVAQALAAFQTARLVVLELFDGFDPDTELAQMQRHLAFPLFSSSLRAGGIEQIRVGWNRQRRSTSPVNRLYTLEIDRIHTLGWSCSAVPSERVPI